MVKHSFEIGDVRFGIRSTSEAFGAWILETLARFQVKDESEPYLSVVVADDDGGLKKDFHILYAGTTAIARTLDPRALAGALLAEVEAVRYGERDDAIFLDAVLATANGHTALIPSRVATSLGSLGRRVDRTGLSLPLVRRVAVDLDTGLVGPPVGALDLRADALDRLSTFVPTNGHPAKAVGGGAMTVDVVCTLGAQSELVVEPAPRNVTLMRLASAASNLETLGGSTLEGLRKLVLPARCYSLAWTDAAATLQAVVGVIGARPER